MRIMLAHFGYKVTARTNSVEAFEIFGSKPDEFDLIITDQTMPNKKDIKLAQKLRSIKPDIPIILCTGFTEAIPEERAAVFGIQGLIMKPIVRNEIVKTIRLIFSLPLCSNCFLSSLSFSTRFCRSRISSGISSPVLSDP